MGDSEAPVLVTGAAGFIGYHFVWRLLEAGRPVVGLDDVNAYYDPALKRARLGRLLALPGFTFVEASIGNREAVEACFARHRFRHVVNLAAQAGVRYSAVNPYAYGESNLEGFLVLLEACRRHGVEHLVFASSSSVYGANTAMPFSVHQNVDHPLSLYAATKKANELMAHTYSHLYGLPTTGLRFFTVYGPWGRPDMALFLFTKAILAGEPIDVFNEGKMRRDFTYVDDIVEGVVRVLARPPAAADGARYAIYNIGNHEPVDLMTFIATLERQLGRTAIKEYLPMQPGDVPATYAAIDRLAAATGFRPHTPLDEGLARFVAWFRGHYSQPAP
jgi:UDP-glucuronate 4-epimerase